MTLSSGDVGYIVWGSSCLIGFSILAIYDGCYQRNMHVICPIYSTYLLCQFLGAIVSVANSFADSPVLSYSFLILLGLAACVYAALAMLFAFVPLGYDVYKWIQFCIPSLQICFWIALLLAPASLANVLLFSLYLPCAALAYVSLLLLAYWHTKRMHIFAEPVGKDWMAAHLRMALIAGTVGMIDFVFPALVFIDLVPDSHTTFWTRACDAIVYVPLIIPLIRSLDKMECFAWQSLVRKARADSKPMLLTQDL